jgi:hypothetical protein
MPRARGTRTASCPSRKPRRQVAPRPPIRQALDNDSTMPVSCGERARRCRTTIRNVPDIAPFPARARATVCGNGTPAAQAVPAARNPGRGGSSWRPRDTPRRRERRSPVPCPFVLDPRVPADP